MATRRADLDQMTEAQRVHDLVQNCEGSRESRRIAADAYRQWEERGADQGPNARYNKVYPHLDRVASYLYDPAGIRFGIHLPADVRERWLPAAAVARDEFREIWHDSGAGLVCLDLIDGALVYGSTVAKVQRDPDGGFSLGYIDPWDLGVGKEDNPDIDAQDLICHWYAMSMREVERWLYGWPNEQALVRLARAHAHIANPSTASRQGLVITNVTGVFPGGTVSGAFPGEPPAYIDQLDPVIDEPLVSFVDVWERRLFRRKNLFGRGKGEVFEDWQVTTMLPDAMEIFLQRRNPDLPWTRTGTDEVLHAEQPFVVMRPRRRRNYLWGRSEIQSLRALQTWLDDHLDDIKKVEKRRLNPSAFFSGVPDAEEAMRAMSTPDGGYGTPEPNARMEPLIPELGQEAFQILKQIDDMFNDEAGMPASLHGEESPGGVRATGQLGMLAGIGAARVRRMALVVEEPLGHIATKGFHIVQRHDPRVYATPDGKMSFLLSQLPQGLTLRVNAHSHAPVFQEQTTQKATLMLKAKAIGLEDFVDMIDPPNREELKARARVLGEQQAKMAQEMLAIQAARAERGPGRPKK
jgi:hypothetical protein